MYVCICNAVNQRVVIHAIGEGARTPEAVWRAAGVHPCCGLCRATIEDMIEDTVDAGSTRSAATSDPRLLPIAR